MQNHQHESLLPSSVGVVLQSGHACLKLALWDCWHRAPEQVASVQRRL